jgi:hypothetical protein
VITTTQVNFGEHIIYASHHLIHQAYQPRNMVTISNGDIINQPWRSVNRNQSVWFLGSLRNSVSTKLGTDRLVRKLRTDEFRVRLIRFGFGFNRTNRVQKAQNKEKKEKIKVTGAIAPRSRSRQVQAPAVGALDSRQAPVENSRQAKGGSASTQLASPPRSCTIAPLGRLRASPCTRFRAAVLLRASPRAPSPPWGFGRSRGEQPLQVGAACRWLEAAWLGDWEREGRRVRC